MTEVTKTEMTNLPLEETAKEVWEVAEDLALPSTTEDNIDWGNDKHFNEGFLSQAYYLSMDIKRKLDFWGSYLYLNI